VRTVSSTICENCGIRPATASVRLSANGRTIEANLCEVCLAGAQAGRLPPGRLSGAQSPLGGRSLFDEFFSDFFRDFDTPARGRRRHDSLAPARRAGGRDRVLQRRHQAAPAARGAEGAGVGELLGDPGVGKTAIVEASPNGS
jgi:hypothetical protein